MKSKAVGFLAILIITTILFLLVKPLNSKAADGVIGYWNRINGILSPATSTDNLILNNFVGIKDSSPSVELDVLGSGKFGDWNYAPDGKDNGLIVTNANGKATSLRLWQQGIGSGQIGLRAGDPNLYIVNTFSSGLITDSAAIALTTAGNVGVGTSTPSEKLEVNGLIVSRETNYVPMFALANSSGTKKWGMRYNLLGSLGFYDWAFGGDRMTIDTNGNVGIGVDTPKYKLDIAGNNSSNTVTRILNNNTSTTADGLVVRLGNNSATAVSTGNHFINFETAGLGNVGSIRGNGAKGVQYVTSGTADFAEYLQKDESEQISSGSLLCIKTDGKVTSCTNDNSNIIGVSSEKPSFLGGNNLGDKSVAVAFLGQVNLRVKGDIKPGDYLTYSDFPGVAVKLTNKGMAVGRALQSHVGNQIDKVMTLVSPNYYSFDR